MLIGHQKRFWGEAINLSVYLKNRLAHKAVKNQTPYEAYYGKKPTIQHLQPFGRKCYVHIPIERRKSGTKLHPRGLEGNFTGYTDSTHIFRIWIPSEQRIVLTRQLTWAPLTSGEASVQTPTIPEQESDPEESDNDSTIVLPILTDQAPQVQVHNQNEAEQAENPLPDTDSENESPNESPSESPEPQEQAPRLRQRAPKGLPPTRRSQRDRQPPRNYWIVETARAVKEILVEPTTYKETQRSPNKVKWDTAMKEEMAALERNNTFDIVPRPDNRRIVDCKWVYKIKHLADGTIERYKARLVAKGFSQQPGYDYDMDELFAPVIRYESLRFLLAICAHYGWIPRQLDIKAAFLNGDLSELIYMELPEGYRQAGMVCKLRKCLYGLKQSSREWYAKLSTSLSAKGFQPTAFDPCVFVHKTEQCYISVYVDDIGIFGPSNSSFINSLISQLQKEFDVTDLGEATWLLGLQIKYTEQGISISQSSYIEKILSKFGMDSSHPVSTPLDLNNKIQKGTIEEQISEPSYYQSIIGSIMYAVTGSRPDLAYTITFLSQFNSCPNNTHLQAAKRVLRYLNGTKDWVLFYPAKQPLVLEGFADASYANDLDTRRSVSGYLFTFGNCAISWKSSKQKSVALSTTEAEYMALSLTARQLIWLKLAAKELRLSIQLALRCDNNGSIELARHPKLNERSKHIDTHYHFTREHLEKKSFELFYVPSADNLADICTKALGKEIHNRLVDKITCRQ
jgi:hypothetical protein